MIAGYNVWKLPHLSDQHHLPVRYDLHVPHVHTHVPQALPGYTSIFFLDKKTTIGYGSFIGRLIDRYILIQVQIKVIYINS